jgi:hypothetical protein
VTHTRTYVVLQVSRQAYDEIRARLIAAGQPERINRGATAFDPEETLDLSDVALEAEE